MEIPGYTSQIIFMPIASDNAVLDSPFLPCDGRLLSANDYPALYALLGTRYGGNGSPNFALPKLDPPFPAGTGVYLICVDGLYPSPY